MYRIDKETSEIISQPFTHTIEGIKEFSIKKGWDFIAPRYRVKLNPYLTTYNSTEKRWKKKKNVATKVLEENMAEFLYKWDVEKA